MELKELKILVVEDEKWIRNNLIMKIHDYGLDANNIKGTSNSSESIKYIESFDPDIILLDLNIPRVLHGLPDISHAFDVMEKVQLYNNKHKDKIKIIVISGTIFDHAVQKIIALSDKVIFKYIDKSGIAENSSMFNSDLKKTIIDVIADRDEEICLDYEIIRDGHLKELEKVDRALWEQIDREIFSEFKKIFSNDSNENVRATNIILKVGKLVEDIISLISKGSLSYNQKELLGRQTTVRKQLNVLSGRRHIKDKGFIEIGQQIISRESVEYSMLAYTLRSEGIHGGKDSDPKNEKLFSKSKPKIEDAAISMNLIVPLIRDYIAFKKEPEISKDRSNFSPGKR